MNSIIIFFIVLIGCGHLLAMDQTKSMWLMSMREIDNHYHVVSSSNGISMCIINYNCTNAVKRQITVSDTVLIGLIPGMDCHRNGLIDYMEINKEYFNNTVYVLESNVNSNGYVKTDCYYDCISIAHCVKIAWYLQCHSRCMMDGSKLLALKLLLN
jgi:hypothetical protein